MGAVFTVVHRFAEPAHVPVCCPEEGTREAKAAQKEEEENPTLLSLKAEGATLKEEFYILIDPWLPLKPDRPLDWKQAVPGAVFFSFRSLSC